jgi:hypothetical protein
MTSFKITVTIDLNFSRRSWKERPFVVMVPVGYVNQSKGWSNALIALAGT